MYYDILPKIKNALRARKESFLTPYSRMDFAVLKILADTKFIKDAQKRTIGRHPMIEVKLNPQNDRRGFTDFKIMSKPSRHLYASYRTLRPVKQGYGLAVLSTPQGLMTNRDARKSKVGGEYLFEVW